MTTSNPPPAWPDLTPSQRKEVLLMLRADALAAEKHAARCGRGSLSERSSLARAEASRSAMVELERSMLRRKAG